MTTATQDVISLFEQQVHSYSSAPAVVSASSVASYGNLYQRSSSIAHLVADCSVQARVLICCSSPLQTYASMIGTLMAGGTFCPLSVECPSGRRAHIIKSFSPHLVLTDATSASDLAHGAYHLQLVDAVAPAERPQQLLASPVGYVVFTSGSSGRPKGVAMSRSGFSYFLAVSKAHFNAGTEDRWAQFSNIGYDLAIMDVFMALSAGAALVPVANSAEALRPASLIARHKVTILQTVPKTAEFLAAEGPTLRSYLNSLRLVSFCGAPLLTHYVAGLFQVAPHLVIQNTYGATETTGYNTRQVLTASNYQDFCHTSAALGTSLPGWSVTLAPSESDHHGEIIVTSPHLALGYWHDQQTTERAFTKDPDDGATRTYRTGDWGEMRDGLLFFRSRIDRQVKIGGLRLELDEIDHHVVSFGATESATICTGSQRLITFVTGMPIEKEKELCAYLAQQFPPSALPSSICAVGMLPRNANGKIDYPALQKDCPK